MKKTKGGKATKGVAKGKSGPGYKKAGANVRTTAAKSFKTK
jgi:hypothetical protein